MRLTQLYFVFHLDVLALGLGEASIPTPCRIFLTNIQSQNIWFTDSSVE
ncbi:hypothetical protein V6Z12_D13G124900 [Gossypium hirsutum]